MQKKYYNTKGKIRELSDTEQEKLCMMGYTNYRWIVCEEYVYNFYFPLNKRRVKVTVPNGFVCDGASNFIKKIDIPRDMGFYWVIHDWLYATHTFDDGTECTRKDADAIIPRCLIREWQTLLIPFRFLLSMIYLAPSNTRPQKAYENSGKRGPVILLS